MKTLYKKILKPVSKKLEAVEEEIKKELESNIGIVARMGEYLLQTKGKRIRPALFLLCSRLLGIRNDRDVVFSTVIEFLHTATLIHDDIIDEADTRRGNKTINAIWGSKLTVLLGDYLYLKAVGIAITERKIEILDILSDITIKMVEGELIQLSNRGNIDISKEAYLDIINRKTANLFSGCGSISAILAEAPEDQAKGVTDYCMNLGIAFQLIDDVLDFKGDGKVLGKPVANDLGEGTVTMPLILAFGQATQDEKENVYRILKSGEPSREDRDSVLKLLNKYGSLEATIKASEDYGARAIKSLDIFPPSDTLDILKKLPPFVIKRSY
ncbi:MAG: polyprenyl synthetase family protein [Desulfobacterales bacterium]|nr:polyprenyl synthetase family protein [Desulfobacterales bacterium]